MIVLGTQIDGSLPIAYAAVFAMLFAMQWTMRKRVAEAYLENQRMTNRMTAQGYTAWDNVFTGNRYNLRLWIGGFKDKLRDGLGRADQGDHDQGRVERGERYRRPCDRVRRHGRDRAPQSRRHGGADRAGRHAAAPDRDDARRASFTSGWNELLAQWARLRGVATNMHPPIDPDFDGRIKFDLLTLREGGEANTVSSLDEAMG